MGGFQRAGTGKNKKVTEVSPCYHSSLTGPKSKNLKNHIFCQKWSILSFVLSS